MTLITGGTRAARRTCSVIGALCLIVVPNNMQGDEIASLLYSFTSNHYGSSPNTWTGPYLTFSDDSFSTGLVESFGYNSFVDLDHSVFEGTSHLDVSAGGGSVSVNFDLQHDMVPGTHIARALAISELSAHVWAPVGDRLRITTSGSWGSYQEGGGQLYLKRHKGFSGWSTDVGILAGDTWEGIAGGPSVLVDGVEYGRLMPVVDSGATTYQVSSDYIEFRVFGSSPGATHQFTGSFTINAENLSREESADSISLVSVDDSNPRNPTVSFDVTGTVENVKWQLGPRLGNLGTLAEGRHTFTVTDLDSLNPATYGLTLEGIGSDGESLSDISSVNLNSLGTQEASRAALAYVLVEGVGAVSARYSVLAEVYASQWELPGAMYDRRVTDVTGIMTSSIREQEVGTSYLTALLDTEGFDNDVTTPMPEVPSIGQPGFVNGAFETPVDIYGVSGVSSIEIDFGGRSGSFGGGQPFILPFSSVKLVLDRGLVESNAVAEPSTITSIAIALLAVLSFRRGSKT